MIEKSEICTDRGKGCTAARALMVLLVGARSTGTCTSLDIVTTVWVGGGGGQDIIVPVLTTGKGTGTSHS